jgi:hypothetical protein
MHTSPDGSTIWSPLADPPTRSGAPTKNVRPSVRSTSTADVLAISQIFAAMVMVMVSYRASGRSP